MCSGKNMCKLRPLWNPFLVDIWNAYKKGHHTMVFSLKNCKIYQKKLFYRKPPHDFLWKFKSVWAYQYMKAYSWQKAFIPAFSNNPLLSFLPLLKNYWSPFPIRPWTVRHPDVFWTYHFLNVNVSIIQWHMKPHHGAGWGPKYFIFDAFEEVYLCLLKRFFCWSILRPFYLVFT